MPHHNSGLHVCYFSVPGLFEGVPGANRARADQQPEAGPAVPAGERGQSGKQDQGAAGVQHPHRCPRRQLMNSQRGSWLSEPMNWRERTGARARLELRRVARMSSDNLGTVWKKKKREKRKNTVFSITQLPLRPPPFTTSWVYFHLSYGPHVIKQAI